MPTIDWQKDASKAFPVYDDGTYKVEIEGWQETVAKSGTPQIRWDAVIRDAHNKSYIGGRISTFTALTPKAMFNIANLVQACNIDLTTCPKMETGTPAFKAVLDACLHQTSYWTVSLNPEYNNNKVDKFAIDPECPAKELALKNDHACPF